MRWALIFALFGCSAETEQQEPASLHFEAGQVLPGEEHLRCVELVSPDRDLFVTAFSVTKERIHHVNVWREPGQNVATPITFECPAVDDGEFLFDDSFREPSESVLPGVIYIPRRSVLRARCHVLNVTQETSTASVAITLSEGSADAQRLYGVALSPAPPQLPDIPPGVTRTVSFEAPPVDLTLYNIFGHQHAHGVGETVSLNGAEIYRATDWAEPTVRREALALMPKDRLQWSCMVQNTSAHPLTWGQNSVETSEMCVVFGLATKEWVTEGKAWMP